MVFQLGISLTDSGMSADFGLLLPSLPDLPGRYHHVALHSLD
jgi:hypothetical protein